MFQRCKPFYFTCPIISFMKLTTDEIGMLSGFKMFFGDRPTLSRRVLNRIYVLFNKCLSGGYINPYNFFFNVHDVLFHYVSGVNKW